MICFLNSSSGLWLVSPSQSSILLLLAGGFVGHLADVVLTCSQLETIGQEFPINCDSEYDNVKSSTRKEGLRIVHGEVI